MEIEIEKSVKTKVEITLPYYCKTNCHAYAIINTDYCTCICYGLEGYLAIQRQPAMAAFKCGIKYEEITEQEFCELYNEVLDKLNELF